MKFLEKCTQTESVQNSALNPIELIFPYFNGISQEGRFYNIGILISWINNYTFCI